MLSGLFTPGHLLVLLVVVLIVFGPKRLPELGRSVGRGIRTFRGGLEGHDDEHAAEVAEARPSGRTADDTTKRA
jgi:sec-independent protein translocase protein TatA